MKMLYEWVDPETGHPAGFISDEVHEIVKKHGEMLDKVG